MGLSVALLCADVCWEEGVLTVRAGALGLTLPVFQCPKPQPTGPEEPKGPLGKLKAKFRARRRNANGRKPPQKQQNPKAQKEPLPAKGEN